MSAVEGSLRRLNTDWIDCYMIHWPDYATPMEETLRALDDLVRAGKVRYIACSNLETWRVADAVWISRHGQLETFIATQTEYNLLNRSAEKDVIPALAHYGLGFIPYYPLASGLLTGKYSAGAAGAGPPERQFPAPGRCLPYRAQPRDRRCARSILPGARA
jgi:aryl-alcohol dehydrogenase-like predicted oxidoreductase